MKLEVLADDGTYGEIRETRVQDYSAICRPRARVMHEARISFSAKKHGWWLFVLVVSISPVLGDRFCFGWRFCQSSTRELWEKKEQVLASQRKNAGRRVQESSV